MEAGKEGDRATSGYKTGMREGETEKIGSGDRREEDMSTVRLCSFRRQGLWYSVSHVR